MVPRWLRDRTKRAIGGVLGRLEGVLVGLSHWAPRRPWAASWVRFGQLLGGSGSVSSALGPSWAPSWGVLGRLGGILEVSCSDSYALSCSLSSAFYVDRLLDRKRLIWGPFSEGRKPTKR